MKIPTLMEMNTRPTVLPSAENLVPLPNPRERRATRVLAGFILDADDVVQLKNKLTRLTSREIEVLQRIANGNANKETASELGIHIKTVGNHREHLMKKLNIHNTAGLTRYAICAGILENSIHLAGC